LLKTSEWTADAVHHVIDKIVQDNGLKFPKVAMPLRVILTGSAQSPSINEVMYILGREVVLKRLQQFF